jgi:hypothetical protein
MAARRSAKDGTKSNPVEPINRRRAATPMSRQDATRARTLRGRMKAMTAPTTGASRIAPPTTFGPVDRSHRSKPATTVTVQATAMPTSRSGGEGCRACFGLSATAHLLPVAGPTCRRPGADGAYIVPVSQARIGSERTLLTPVARSRSGNAPRHSAHQQPSAAQGKRPSPSASSGSAGPPDCARETAVLRTRHCASMRNPLTAAQIVH